MGRAFGVAGHHPEVVGLAFFESFDRLADFDVFCARADVFGGHRDAGTVRAFSFFVFGGVVFELVGGREPFGVDGSVQGGFVLGDFGCCFGGGGGGSFTLQRDAVEEHLLHRSGWFDRDASVRPGVETRVGVRSCVVVVACEARHDVRIRLCRLGDQHGRERFVRAPARAVVGRDPREAFVVFAVGGVATVIPTRLDNSAGCDPQRRHPLRLARAICVQAQRRAPRRAVVRRANVEDVGFIRTRSMRRIDVLDDAARPDGRLSEARLAPDRGDRREVATAFAAGNRKRRPHRR